MRFIARLIPLAIIVAGIAVAVRAISRRPEAIVIQPLAFDHAIHLDSAGMECLDCHANGATGVYAGLPSKAVCLDCHDLEDEAEPGSELARLVPYAESNEDLPWARVAVTKPDVYFSHRRHVTSGGIECLRCHGDQPTLTAPPSTARLVMTMDDCIACHEESGTTVDCLACHR